MWDVAGFVRIWDVADVIAVEPLQIHGAAHCGYGNQADTERPHQQ
jgi:hypothetical protein